MIQLLAMAPEDGWAFVRSADRILLLRPPYGKRRHPAVEESTVARAVAVEGFAATDQAFHDWPSVFSFLEERFLAERQALPAALAPEAVERILRHAPGSALEGLLDRIERDLLPARQWDAAGELLARFLAVDSPAAVVLRPRAADLLGRCHRMRSTVGQARRRLEVAARAPLTAAKYGPDAVRTYMEQVRQAGSFFGASAA